MSSGLPSSFASAAAGQSRDARAGRGGSGSGSGEWSRRDGRSANGTLTFRRPSNAPFSHSQQASDITPVQTPATENPPTLPPSMPTDGSLRYTKEQLLALAKAQAPSVDLSSLLVSGWNPGQVNGTPARGWGKTNENHVPQDPGVCWDANGQVKPIGLQEMSAEERELFSSDVNSTLKPPQQNKEGTHQGGSVNGRKASISHGSNYGMSSPSTASRPGTRRRETGDTNPFPGAGLASPTATGRFSRDDGPWFGRKSLDTKESTFEEPEEEQKLPSAARATSGFGNLVRDPAPGGNSGFGSAANLWGSATGTSSGAGMGGFGSFAMPTSAIGEKRVGLSRGESRLAHLIPKDSSENIVGKAIEPSADPNRSWRSRPRTDTDPFAADDALGGRQDVNSPHQGQPYETPVKGSAVDFGMSGLNLGGEAEGSGSPQTNPYRSPPERGDHGADDAPGDMTSQGLGGIPDHMSNLNSISRGFPTGPFDGSDRSQTSSVGAKGFPAINTFGGWPSTVGTGTPDRERSGFGNAFGSSLFSPASDLQSPGGFGGMGMFGPASTSSIGAGGSMRQSKLGALFPAALQAQMQNQDQDNLSDTGSDFRQVNPLGAIGRASAGPARDTNSPLRRGGLEDVLSESTRSPGPFGTSGPAQHGLTTTAQPAPFQGSQPAGEPAGQHRSMVMPDRMRWVYLDPQGQIQGPFTGLEMNDWYKANFFTPDLRVKKIEDAEFEPLGQLIRRIGNSREPFLVPQMGIPHGPPASSGQQFPTGDRGVIPPLVGAFPSFGRTLTAEEQNNLERRKQEEQFMMARQREFMAQHTFPKMPMPGASGLPSALHHHSSAHSLQSQPSFGSIASPIGPNQPPVGAIGPNSAFFEAQTGATQPSGAQGASAEFELSMQERDVLANLQPSGAPNILQQGRSSDASSLRSNLPAADQLQKDTQGFSERLKEFHNLRAARDAAEEAAKNGGMATVNEELNEDPSHGLPNEAEVARMLDEAQAEELDMASLSLTQQVQKTQAAAAAAKQQPPPQDVWKQPADLPMPFPPPQQQGSTPIAAPTAQRTRSTLPDQYASRSRSETPESGVAAQPPPLAPWARDPGSESHKGPSLREIQEAEAKKAAKAEEQAAAARRAALEQEAAAIREREKAGAAVAPGLPTTSTWGNGSPVTTSSSSPWTKPAAAKVAPANAASSSASAKKTLADIQREEEARKQRAAKDHASQAAKDHASQIAAAATSAMGKRYADLASKAQAPTTAAAMVASGAAPPAGSGWATVGAGGKVKIPTGPSAQSRSVSTGNVKPVPAAAPARPVVKQSVSTMAKTDAGSVAMDEFNKWVHRELSRGITGGIDVDTFAATLQNFPLEHQLIADAVYGSSTTMDGRHFADEYIRRKKLADRGVVEKQPAADAGKGAGAGGGWSEVAKKGGAAAGAGGGQGPQAGKEEGMPAGFKVVPGRKKGKK